VVASGDDKSVEMIFFGDLARDLVGKPADVLVAKNSGFLATVPVEIDALIRRSYVVDVIVSRYSFHIKDISFQVFKFYPEGSSVFLGLAGVCRKSKRCITSSCWASVMQNAASGMIGSLMFWLLPFFLQSPFLRA
jgi:hypothetical protein